MSARLVRRLTFSLGLCWLLAVGAAALVIRFELNEVFDSVLQEAAQHLLPDILAEQGERLMAPPPEGWPITVPAAQHDEYITYQILTPQGEVRLRSHDAPLRPYALPVQPGFGRSERGRPIYTEFSTDGRFAIQIAEPALHRAETVRHTILLLLLPLALLIPTSIWLVARTVRASLRPIATLQREIEQRSRSNTAPLQGRDLPGELVPIREHVNSLLLRLGQALESERNFAANSAHELRTPVAAAMAQAQLLERQLGTETADGARAAMIAVDLRRLSRQIEKLLQLARAEAGIALRREAVALAPLARLVIEEFDRHHGEGTQIRLILDAEPPPVVRGDLDAIAIALRNLIENAVLHGVPGQPVTVTLRADGSVWVENAGAVVPKAALAELTRPFMRNGTQATGSGLGLSIVETIMRQGEGALELHAPCPGRDDGFAAVLRFPPAAPGAGPYPKT